jgi:uncharacterized protein YbjQ (UPF0145 family)
MNIMRNVALLLLLALACVSCYVYRPYENQLEGQLMEVPLAKQDKELELFFAGESMPEKDYLRLGMLKEARTSYNTNLKSLLDRLKTKAEEMGADAIIIMGAGDTERVHSVGEDNTYSVPSENMWGLAIRYLDNLQFEENVLSHLEVTGLDANTKSANGVIDIALDGSLDAPVSDKWMQYVYNHSLEYLMESEQDWRFTKVQVDTPSNLYDIIRVQSQGVATKAKVRISYDRYEWPTDLRITYLNQRQVNENMVLVYDDQNRIVERRWKEYGGKNMVVTRSYDAAGLVTREDYSMQRGDSEIAPYLSVDYHYFTEDDLMQMIEKEQVVRVGS